ncbi:MAG: CDP-diacylglycerol--serine O-phosphatidyltransferase [Pelagibacteraceae bacterium TMED216]|nr:MAG: CDP-diacylglycerol--serine O-phosphatidyltransferase [Pelagibacteraceae bacterium TMED216]|tara:strand:- start:317 stop:1105 length:789 start_codon:yes stop_codon:yes gene_type:complete
MEEKKFKIVSSKKTRYLLPNLLTIVGVCLGISSIKFSIDQNFSLAVTFILLAAILDALDGRIARLIKGTSDFGKELDSLTDFVSFGIAPSLIIYFWELNSFGKIGWTITLLYSVCCVLRLARFNLTNHSKNDSWKMNYFEGIPSPIGAILILLPLIYEISDFRKFFEPKILAPYITILVSVLLISKIPTFSFKKISIPSKLTIFILLFTGLSFISLMFFMFETLLVFCFLYILTLPVSIYLFKKNKNNFKDNTFDEDHEDIL